MWLTSPRERSNTITPHILWHDNSACSDETGMNWVYKFSHSVFFQQQG